MKVTILGCGTSGGVPRAPLLWGDCDPNEPKNKRTRASVLISDQGHNILVDTSPDLRNQILDNDIRSLDAVLYTHDHADHCHGIDDLRGFYQDTRNPMPVYGDKDTMKTIMERFNYIFHSQNGYPAICTGHMINGPFAIGSIQVTPFLQGHGNTHSIGYRFGDIAYSTDLNHLPDESKAILSGVKIWIVDALRYDPHASHAHLDMTLGWIDEIKPKTAVLTHLAWQMDYQTLKAQLPPNIIPAYDGLSFTV